VKIGVIFTLAYAFVLLKKIQLRNFVLKILKNLYLTLIK